MLAKYRVATALPAQDLERAKAFYKEKLDMSPTQEDPMGIYFECGEGTGFVVFMSSGQSDGGFTQMGFEVDDVDATVKDLAGRGVTFERYDSEWLKTDENGIAEMSDGERGAWFKDSEGNLIAVGQRRS